MRKPKQVYIGKNKYARAGLPCRICGTWLYKGKRKANQFLCNNDDSRDRTACQREYYKRKRDVISATKPKPDYGELVCDICQKTVKRTDPLQKRCTSGKKGILSKCQREGMRKNTKNKPRKKRYVGTVKVITKKRTCLKCDKKFDSLHPFNRICDKCTVLNDRGGKKEHKVMGGMNTSSTDFISDLDKIII